jgi:cell division protein FtsB
VAAAAAVLVRCAPMKWMAMVLAGALLLLQYRLWLSDDGMRGLISMQRAVSQQQEDNLDLSRRNRQLLAEVRDLKQGYAALEERARNDLGMIGDSETFYQVVTPVPAIGPATAPAAGAVRTATRPH